MPFSPTNQLVERLGEGSAPAACTESVGAAPGVEQAWCSSPRCRLRRPPELHTTGDCIAMQHHFLNLATAMAYASLLVRCSYP